MSISLVKLIAGRWKQLTGDECHRGDTSLSAALPKTTVGLEVTSTGEVECLNLEKKGEKTSQNEKKKIL